MSLNTFLFLVILVLRKTVKTLLLKSTFTIKTFKVGFYNLIYGYPCNNQALCVYFSISDASVRLSSAIPLPPKRKEGPFQGPAPVATT